MGVLPSEPVITVPAGAWTTIEPLNVARYDAKALRLGDGRVLVRGGRLIDVDRARREGGEEWMGREVAEDEIWDPERAGWRVIPAAMADELAAGAVAAAPGPKPTGWKSQATARDVDRLACKREGDTRIALSSRVLLIAGGYLTWSAFHGETSESMEAGAVVYRAQFQRWQFAGKLAKERSEAAGVLLADGRAMLIGGKDVNRHDCFTAVELWEPVR